MVSMLAASAFDPSFLAANASSRIARTVASHINAFSPPPSSIARSRSRFNAANPPVFVDAAALGLYLASASAVENVNGLAHLARGAAAAGARVALQSIARSACVAVAVVVVFASSLGDRLGVVAVARLADFTGVASTHSLASSLSLSPALIAARICAYVFARARGRSGVTAVVVTAVVFAASLSDLYRRNTSRTAGSPSTSARVGSRPRSRTNDVCHAVISLDRASTLIPTRRARSDAQLSKVSSTKFKIKIVTRRRRASRRRPPTVPR